MIKKIIVTLLLINTFLYGQSLSLKQLDKKRLLNLGVKITSIYSSAQGFIENNDSRSVVYLSTISLKKDHNRLKVYNPFYYEGNDKNYNAQPRKAIIVLSKNTINVLIDQYSPYKASLGAVYPFKVQTIEREKLDILLPKNIKTREGIIIPTPAGIDIYLFWNGSKYEIITSNKTP